VIPDTPVTMLPSVLTEVPTVIPDKGYTHYQHPTKRYKEESKTKRKMAAKSRQRNGKKGKHKMTRAEKRSR
jgi:hypothetical protein